MHRIDENPLDPSAIDTVDPRDLPAVGLRMGTARAPRDGRVSFLYGLSATVLASKTVGSKFGRGRRGGVVGIAGASIGLAL